MSQKQHRIRLILLNHEEREAIATGNNAAWCCQCGRRQPLIGRSGGRSSISDGLKVYCPDCARCYFVVPEDKDFGRALEVRELDPNSETIIHAKLQSASVADLRNHPTLTPPHDSIFSQLLQAALTGEIAVYFAAIPLRLIKPFSSTYDPRLHPLGKLAVAAVKEEWKNERFKNMIVYPQGDNFVMSDDYITYYASLEGQPDFVPCWIMGQVTSADVCDVQGPIRGEDLRTILLGVAD